jgi:hypothetical protein
MAIVALAVWWHRKAERVVVRARAPCRAGLCAATAAASCRLGGQAMLARAPYGACMHTAECCRLRFKVVVYTPGLCDQSGCGWLVAAS